MSTNTSYNFEISVEQCPLLGDMEFNVRLAGNEDYQAVLEMSKEHYEGHDNAPSCFKQWLIRDNITVLIATYQQKAIGLCAVSIVDEGQTFFSHGLRIHPHYRGKGFGTQLILAVREFVRQNYPNVLRERYTTGNTHHARLAIASKTKDKLLFQQDSYAFVVKKDRIQLSKPDGLNSSYLSMVYKYDVEKFKKDLEKSQDLFKQGIMVINYEPYKAVPSNVDLCIEEGDYLFTDRTQALYLPQSNQIRSFSHGCIVRAAKFTQWAVTVFTNDLALFQGHLLLNLQVACQHIQEDIIFRINHDRDKFLKETAVKLLQGTLGLEPETTRFEDFYALLFEKELY